MRRRETLSSRERVRLALEHRETDRIPIAMVCSGINPPARRELEAHLQRERGIDVQTYLDSFIDIRQVAPAYTGPPLASGEDIWGVRRAPVSYGSGSYDEIMHYPLAEVKSVADLEKHRWPGTEYFDYSVLPKRIAAAQARPVAIAVVERGPEEAVAVGQSGARPRAVNGDGGRLPSANHAPHAVGGYTNRQVNAAGQRWAQKHGVP